MFLGSFCQLFLFCFQAEALVLDRGRPGCWDDIRPSFLTDAEIKALDPDCKNLRTDYAASLKLIQKNKKEFQKQVVAALTKSTSVAPPYEAILFATFSGDEAMKSALQKRAETEKRLKVPFRYAEVALYRLEGKACDENKEFLHPFYREVCFGKDSILKSYFEPGVTK